MGKRFIVCGKPACGKSTWVRDRAKPGDLVWDFDAISEVVFRQKSYPRPKFVLDVMQAMRDAALSTLRQQGKHAIYFIVTEKADADAIADWIDGFEVVHLQIDEVERHCRIASRTLDQLPDIEKELMEGL